MTRTTSTRNVEITLLLLISYRPIDFYVILFTW